LGAVFVFPRNPSPGRRPTPPGKNRGLCFPPNLRAAGRGSPPPPAPWDLAPPPWGPPPPPPVPPRPPRAYGFARGPPIFFLSRPRILQNSRFLPRLVYGCPSDYFCFSAGFVGLFVFSLKKFFPLKSGPPAGWPGGPPVFRPLKFFVLDERPGVSISPAHANLLCPMSAPLRGANAPPPPLPKIPPGRASPWAKSPPAIVSPRPVAPPP